MKLSFWDLFGRCGAGRRASEEEEAEEAERAGRGVNWDSGGERQWTGGGRRFRDLRARLLVQGPGAASTEQA